MHRTKMCELSMYVEDFVRQCVLFLGTKDDRTGQFIPRATAFVVSVHEQDIGFRFVVTAEHNIVYFGHRRWKIFVRSNLKDGGVREDDWSEGRWYFHPDPGSTDVAISPIDFSPEEEFKQIVLRTPDPDRGIVATAEKMKEHKIGLGDEVFVVGLFRSHYGQQRNVPIIRVGNIAMLKGEPCFYEVLRLHRRSPHRGKINMGSKWVASFRTYAGPAPTERNAISVVGIDARSFRFKEPQRGYGR
jgi:hypothetical protein